MSAHTHPVLADRYAVERSWPTPPPVELAVIVPTFNERANILEFIAKLTAALQGLRWEAVFVDDDSPDGTAEVLRETAVRDSRIRLLHRVGRRGLSSACIEGMLSTAAPYIAVMDADMQHDERILPVLLGHLRTGSLDLVIATRHGSGVGLSAMSAGRQTLSNAGKALSRFVCRSAVSDPMSGFFAVQRGFLLEVVRDLEGTGFKILLDLLTASKRPVRFAEVDYHFRPRRHGNSKLDARSALDLLFQVIHLGTRRLIPARFASFAMVGAGGLLTHFLVMLVLFRYTHLRFVAAQTAATLVAMAENFFVNNLVTYRDRSLHGLRLWTGLLTFALACSFGAWANVSFAGTLLHSGLPWYVAACGGLLLSAVWNYAVSSLFTWQLPPVAAAPVRANAELSDRQFLQ